MKERKKKWETHFKFSSVMLLWAKAEESGRPNSADCQAGTDTSSPRRGKQAMLPEAGGTWFRPMTNICLFIDTQLPALGNISFRSGKE